MTSTISITQSINRGNASIAPRSIALFLLGLVSAFAVATASFGQQAVNTTADERERGIQLYNQNQNHEAISELRNAVKKNKDDGDAWYFLGLALTRADDMKAARKAFESAVKLKPDFGPAHTGLAYGLVAAGKDADGGREANTAIRLRNSDPMAHYLLGVVQLRGAKPSQALTEAETAISQNQKFGPPHLLKSQALLALEGEKSAQFAKVITVRSTRPPSPEEIQQRKEHARQTRELFAQAAAALQTYLTLARSDSETAMWKEQLETLQIFAATDRASSWNIFNGTEVTTKVRVLKKPEPTYTEQARNAGVEGTVVLRAVFSATGAVEHILVLRSLPGGLTQSAIAAAKKISFTPATKDGKPVAVMMELQYNFNVY